MNFPFRKGLGPGNIIRTIRMSKICPLEFLKKNLFHYTFHFAHNDIFYQEYAHETFKGNLNLAIRTLAILVLELKFKKCCKRLSTAHLRKA